MSVSSLLSTRPELRAYLNEHFHYHAPIKPGIPVVEPRTSRTSLIGIAFDYALRWHAQIRNPLTADRGHWVAENALEKLPRLLRRKAEHEIRVARALLARAIHNHRYPVLLLRSALQLGRLDLVYRAHFIDDAIGTDEDPADVDDLVSLMRIVPPTLVAPGTQCLLNPVFTKSKYVGGADADLVVGDTLIDVKASKRPTIEKDWFNQILCYYLLYNAAGFSGCASQPAIHRIGLYLARHGISVTWRVADLAAPSVFDEASGFLLDLGLESGGEPEDL